MIDWKEVYQLPLKLDEFTPHYAFSSNGTMALTMNFKVRFRDDREFMTKLVEIINGTRAPKCKPGTWTHDGCDFYHDEDLIFYIRGWGHLTGCSAMNLSPEEAAKVQDGFINYIQERLDSNA